MVDKIHTDTPLLYRKIILWAALILLIAILAIFFAVRFANSQYNRDLRNLEIIVDITADTRSDNITSWVNDQVSEMRNIASNVTVQLYMTEKHLADNGQAIADEAAQIDFIRNYLEASAQRAGFVSKIPKAKVNANLKRQGDAGFAIVNNDGKIITATSDFPDSKTINIGDFIGQNSKSNDIYFDQQREAHIAFSAPIFAVQGDHKNGSQIGWAVGIRDVDQLYQILKKPKAIYKTEQSVIVRQIDKDAMFEYISPLSDEISHSHVNLEENNNHKLASYLAFMQPNDFVVAKDYRAVETFVTGRKIPQTNWVMVHKIDRKEALYNSDQRRKATITISSLLIGLLAMLIFAVWRHGSSVRYKQLAEKFKSQEGLLRLVTDNQQDKIFIIDQQNRYCFANRKVIQAAKIEGDQILGKTVENVFGPAKEEKYSATIKDIGDNSLKQIHRFLDDGEAKIMQLKYVPLTEVPHILTGETTSGTLIVENDITDLVTQKEKNERLLRSVIDTLVSVVDSRDPYSANQSKNVAELAQNIAIELNAQQDVVDTAVTAARLMNLGKIIAPRELLNKQGKLTPKEKKIMAATKTASADFIKGLEFNGPVEDTLRQMQERWDGSGPLELKGNKSLLTARIISIANEYVAMTSPRSYRDKMPQEKAIDIFMKEIGKKYERKLVVALVNYLENKSDV